MEKPTTSSTCQWVDLSRLAISTAVWRSRSKHYDINDSGDWTAESMTMVEVDDVLDHGGNEIKILYFLERFQWQVVKANGKVITMNSNHETLNVERDFLYMSESGCEEFRVWAHNNMMRQEPLKSSIDIQPKWNMLDQIPFSTFCSCSYVSERENVNFIVSSLLSSLLEGFTHEITASKRA
ncbi:shewanella-like protein phosphatase 1 [Quercus lobata]|uniref:shewanella-like protein phosphatase 1 n=1 Tax=Quercus lobata TaxID=97700 RepID=UPI001248F0B7|nr:shewanella-like protein phosphatase 1 [Quercus lobata]